MKKRVLGTWFLVLSALVITHCGGSSGTSAGGATTVGGFSMEVSVTAPTNASLAAPLKIGKQGFSLGHKTVTEETAAGVEVHCENLAGETIGEPCTTDSSGTCEIIGTEDEEEDLCAGVILVADNGIPLHDYEEFCQEALDASEASGDPIPATVNTESDLAYAVLVDSCENDLAACGETHDRGCFKEAMESIVNQGDPGTNDVGGYVEGLLTAHANAFVNGEAGTNPAALIQSALGGDPSGIVAITGSEVSDVPVADAASNTAILVNTIKEAYCEKDTSTGTAPWQDIKTEGGESFDSFALTGPMRDFTPDEFGSIEAEDFRGFASGIPALTGGFAMFSNNGEARRAMAEQFRFGGFTDPSKAGAALGMLFSTFPSDGDFTGFDPTQAAQAAHNGFLEYTSATTSYADPATIYNNFHDTLSNPTYRQSWASGGSAAAGDFIAGFVSQGANFVATDYQGTIKQPPGGACDADDDCLPCDSCVSSVCSSLSTKMGLTCTTNTDCDSITSCVGGYMAGAGGRCMCTSGVPTGAYVHDSAGGGPMAYGATGGYTPPVDGAVGGRCGAGFPDCTVGTCSGDTYGVCLDGDFKKGPYMSCDANADCYSESCVGGMCAAPSSTTVATAGGAARTLGQACTVHSECATWFCSAALCAEPPDAMHEASGIDNRKENGLACSGHAECFSNYCSGTCQTPPSEGSSLPTGSPCMMMMECQSMMCNFSGGGMGTCS